MEKERMWVVNVTDKAKMNKKKSCLILFERFDLLIDRNKIKQIQIHVSFRLHQINEKEEKKTRRQ